MWGRQRWESTQQQHIGAAVICLVGVDSTTHTHTHTHTHKHKHNFSFIKKQTKHISIDDRSFLTSINDKEYNGRHD